MSVSCRVWSSGVMVVLRVRCCITAPESSILSSGFRLDGILQHMPWVSSGFLGFVPPPKNMQVYEIAPFLQNTGRLFQKGVQVSARFLSRAVHSGYADRSFYFMQRHSRRKEAEAPHGSNLQAKRSKSGRTRI